MKNGTNTVGTRGRFLKRVWQLTAPYWRSEERLLAWGLLVTIVAMTLGLVGINVLLNQWNRDFYNVLQARDLDQFPYLLGYFCVMATVFIVVAVYRLYLTQMLEMRWRTWLTDRYVGSWLDNQVYYRMELQNGAAGVGASSTATGGTDNPDQRIQEDLRSFTTGTLSLSLGLLSSVVTLVSFVTILWTISGPLTFMLFGSEVTIPGYMVWAAVVYAAVGSVLTHYVGRRLIGLNFQQERLEADFRFSLVRLRENAEGVALYRGEAPEGDHLRRRFRAIQANWWQLMAYTKRLTFFTNGYGQLTVIFPILLVTPRYLSGAIDLGTMFQVSNAFRQVEGSLSWFVDSYSRLADWKASVDRLLTFHDALERTTAEAQREEGVRVVRHPGPELRVEGLDLVLPGGRVIVPGALFNIAPGSKVLVTGPSGSGKSTLFRALAGIWPYGKGQVSIPKDASILFLPQKPYIPIGSLRDAVAYPASGDSVPDAKIREALEAVQLGQFGERLDEAQNWSMQLSGGEQQRLAVARAVLHQPDWLFLDEATSALDSATEQQVYGVLRERLPRTTILSIAHGSGLAAFHDSQLELVRVNGHAEIRRSDHLASQNGTAAPAPTPAPSSV